MEINKLDLEYLKEEYKEARKHQFTKGDYCESQYHHGIARGLELSLVRIGVLNDDLDKITQEAYHEVRAE